MLPILGRELTRLMRSWLPWRMEQLLRNYARITTATIKRSTNSWTRWAIILVCDWLKITWRSLVWADARTSERRQIWSRRYEILIMNIDSGLVTDSFRGHRLGSRSSWISRLQSRTGRAITINFLSFSTKILLRTLWSSQTTEEHKMNCGFPIFCVVF